MSMDENPISPRSFAALIIMVVGGEINQNTAKEVLSEMFATGKSAEQIVEKRGLRQISDSALIEEIVQNVLAEHPDEVAEYLGGKENIANWLFGQIMRAAKGQGNPRVIRKALDEQLDALRSEPQE